MHYNKSLSEFDIRVMHVSMHMCFQYSMCVSSTITMQIAFKKNIPNQIHLNILECQGAI